eukprot:2712696-Pyramimonas_sp.AAC.1
MCLQDVIAVGGPTDAALVLSHGPAHLRFWSPRERLYQLVGSSVRALSVRTPEGIQAATVILVSSLSRSILASICGLLNSTARSLPLQHVACTRSRRAAAHVFI